MIKYNGRNLAWAIAIWIATCSLVHIAVYLLGDMMKDKPNLTREILQLYNGDPVLAFVLLGLIGVMTYCLVRVFLELKDD